MATVLYRLGRFSHRRRWVVLAAWALILVLAGVGAKTLSGPMSNTFSIPGTESQRALDLMSARIPQSNADAASARVVWVGDVSNGKAAVERSVSALKKLPNVASVTNPYQTQAVSQNGDTAYATVTYTLGAADITAADQSRLMAAGQVSGLKVYFGGEAVQSSNGSGGSTEGIGVAVAAVVLVITFGSLLAAGLPLLTALLGVGLGLAGITTISGFVHLAATTSALASMLGLAVGIDYALFIVSRYRHELLAGHDPDDAAGRAVGTAGSAVVFAGATVIIALVALTVVNIPFLAAMGLGAAATVLIAVVVALTLLPALLGFMGARVLGRKREAARDTEADGPLVSEPVGARWARFVVRRRLPLALLVIVGLGVVALPALHMRLALPSDASAAPDSTQRKAYDALAKGFGAGFNGPLLIAADLKGASPAATARIQGDLAHLPDTAAVAPATVVNQLALYTLIPTSGPDDAATETLVHTIRSRASGWHSTTGATVYVTGATAVGIDVSERLNGALIPYLAVVVGLAFLLLMLVFRSIVVPLKATLGFLLSLAATFGAVVTVFQNGHLASLFGVPSSGPILSFLPILVIGILFGLAMDYEVFLVTRMREEHVHGASAQDAVVHGFRHGARVVTAAAIIMTSVFAGFLLSSDSIIKSLGFALTAGVLFDAFLVRMTLVPAVMSLLGRAAWMIPAWLDRALPDVDVEGERLTELLATGAIPSQRAHSGQKAVEQAR